MTNRPLALLLPLCFALALPLHAREKIRLVSNTALSPDGKTLAFSWRGDLWSVSSEGGTVTPLTSHQSDDEQPKFSPDGKRIAFVSERSGTRQVYVMPATGGAPQQLTWHSEGYSLDGWYPDGQHVLVNASRDHYWRHAERFYKVNVEKRKAPELLFDAYGSLGSLSPDGKKLLYVREGERWWRKGYRGSGAAQIWLYDVTTKEHLPVVRNETESRYPVWNPNGKSFYYVSGKSGSFNLWEHDLQTGAEKQLTTYDDDSVIAPCISADGATIVYRHLFDLYRVKPTSGDMSPKLIEIYYDGDQYRDEIERRTLSRATEATFSSDGLEVAFIAGGDLWVMDTELREPKRITDTPEEERSPLFAPDDNSILFASDRGGQSDLYKATRGDEEKYWWQNDKFNLERLTNDPDFEEHLAWTPKGDQIAFVKGRGDLCMMKPNGKDARRILESWVHPDYDFSPDGKWIVYGIYDNDFNHDVWIMPLDKSRKPFNLSRHPDNDLSPRWSPDGKMIAFTSKVGDETDAYVVYLTKEGYEEDARDRKLEAALNKMKGRPKKKPMSEPMKKPATDGKKPDDPKDKKPDAKKREEKKPEKKEDLVIDFEGIHDRMRRIAIPSSTESNLFWSPDSKKLAFTATVGGSRGTYTIELPDKLSPKKLTSSTGDNPQWVKNGNRILWLVNGVPTSTSSSGSNTSYPFSVLQTYSVKEKNAAAFDVAWRLMRDNFYDGKHNNRNWDEIRRKYVGMAKESPDSDTLSRVVNLMLGELNGSHLGFYASGSLSGILNRARAERTAHFGLRFDPTYKGPGLKVKDVIPGSPASEKRSKIEPGEIVVSINAKTVDPGMDLTEVLNWRTNQDFHLQVKNAKGEVRDVLIRPISFGAARSLLYKAWIEHNREVVDKKSQGKLGYLHIAAMSFSSFRQFEKDLYAAGAGKEGLIIDVRENGGGSTTDHLLTALTQPAHAITVPRGGGPGYPQDRKVYATWNKPIIVLCNQNSFSNAEIFSHAIKGLKRGKLVGVTTGGGVISTGSATVMDVGRIRMPFRAWFVAESGEDMELNGAKPHFEIWPLPGDLPSGVDKQLDKAIEVLSADVKEWMARPRPKLIWASQRRLQNK